MFEHGVYSNIGAIAPSSNVCMNADWHQMVADVSLFEVANAPTNMYDYTLPKRWCPAKWN